MHDRSESYDELAALPDENKELQEIYTAENSFLGLPFISSRVLPDKADEVPPGGGIRIHIVDTPGQETLSFATPCSNHMMLSEKVAETGRPAIAFETVGDIHLRAAGRIHQHAGLASRQVDGKIMHGVSIRIVNTADQSLAYQTQALGGSLTDSSPVQVAVGNGQHFPNIPPGSNQFHVTPMMDALRNWEMPEEEPG